MCVASRRVDPGGAGRLYRWDQPGGSLHPTTNRSSLAQVEDSDMNTLHPPQPRFSEQELASLKPLRGPFPNTDAALAEIARLSAERQLPKGTVHVISDVHGEYAKLRHVINNASGSLRPLVQRLFADQRSPAELGQF